MLNLTNFVLIITFLLYDCYILGVCAIMECSFGGIYGRVETASTYVITAWSAVSYSIVFDSGNDRRSSILSSQRQALSIDRRAVFYAGSIILFDLAAFHSFAPESPRINNASGSIAVG